jgi:hypothetical protein
MLARRTLARTLPQPPALGAIPSNARNMATLREIELRLKSVKNIEKITKVNYRLSAQRMQLMAITPVNENDCINQAVESSAGYANWQAVWNRQYWSVYSPR